MRRGGGNLESSPFVDLEYTDLGRVLGKKSPYRDFIFSFSKDDLSAFGSSIAWRSWLSCHSGKIVDLLAVTDVKPSLPYFFLSDKFC